MLAAPTKGSFRHDTTVVLKSKSRKEIFQRIQGQKSDLLTQRAFAYTLSLKVKEKQNGELVVKKKE